MNDDKAFPALPLGNFFDTQHNAEMLERLIIKKSDTVFPDDVDT